MAIIYIVEDDESARELILYALKKEGFIAKGFSSSKEFFLSLESEKPSLILLDLMLPEEDGLGILRRLKKNKEYTDIPVIIESAKGEEFDKVSLLDSGADDYLVKPFGMMELSSRINAVLRRVNSKNEDELKSGDVTLNKSSHVVKVSGRAIELTSKEFSLLEFLMNNKGRVYTRDELLNSVWGFEYLGESRTIDVHIGTLRHKLLSSGRIIKTVKGVGYKIDNE